MTAICFYNDGAFDKRAFTMMGLSAKPNDSAIGFFGTGFKYAIAALLRHNCTVRVVTETDTYDFSTAPGNFRGKEYQAVYCTVTSADGIDDDPIELPFTTHLGINWKLWQAYRELYTNAKDEGGSVERIDGTPRSSIGDVRVYVTGDEFVKIYEQHDKYFLTAETIAQGSRLRAVEKHFDHDNVVYYKTMYTGTKLDKPSLLTYDYTKTVELTEDRTLADTWYVRSHIAELWLEHMPYDSLINYLPKIASDTFYEYNLDASYHTGSEDFHRACAYLNACQKSMPMWARDTYTKSLPFDQQVNLYTPTRYQLSQFWKAINVMRHHRMMIDPDKITFCASLPNDVLGYYRKGDIYIAKEAFERGFEKLLGTMYEEYLHMVKECEDMSRNMQNVLVDQVASLMLAMYEMEDFIDKADK